MRLSRVKIASAVALIGAVGVSAAAVAGGRSGFDADLSGYQEVPLTISTGGSGTFEARLNRSGTELKWKLHYEHLEGGAVQQAHIHFGAKGLANGVSVFLCSNLGNGPAGTLACPAPPATIEGTAAAADVRGPVPQCIAAGEFGQLSRGMRAGVTYANVHTATY